MKPFIILFGANYYPAGWSDYAGEADSIDEALKIVSEKTNAPDFLHPGYYWFEIIDLRTKEVVKSG